MRPEINARNACVSLGILAVIVSIGLVSTSFKRLKSTEYGVEYDIFRKKIKDLADNGGLHAGPPGFRFIKVPSTFISEELESETCVSKDGLAVIYSVRFQYQINENSIKPAIIKYRDFENWAKVVVSAGRRAVQHGCSEFSIANFQNKRDIIQTTMFNNLKGTLEGSNSTGDRGVYTTAVSLQLLDLTIPFEYRSAVADKQSAEEDIQLAKNQRKQETTKALTELLAAKEQVRQILDTANNEANITVREAVLKAEEIELSFQTEAILIVNIKEALNLTTQGVLAYMANQLYENAPMLKVHATEPASISWKGELLNP